MTPRALAALALVGALSPTRAAHAQPVEPGPSPVNPLDVMQGPLELSWTREASGTAWQPDATPMFGMMQRLGGWSVMKHFNAFGGVDASAGPRGAVAAFSTNWFMATLRHGLGGGQFGARVMLSFEDLTTADGGYPLLLQTGERYRGMPLHDRQRPHDFFMELGLTWQRELSQSLALQVYVAASGEPALGPVAFAQRITSFYDPLAPVSRRWLGATHVSFGVVTAAIYTRHVKLEGSWFNGRESDEDRWNLDLDLPDSWSARATVNPARGLSVQASYGFLRAPEALRPGASQHRATASATSVVRFGASQWATTAAWGIDATDGRPGSNAFLVESSLNLLGHYIVYGRAEYVAKAGRDLGLSARQREGLFEVGSVSLGAAYAFSPVLDVVATFGVRGSLAVVGSELRSAYGETVQAGGVAYVQLRPREMRPAAMTYAASTNPGGP